MEDDEGESVGGASDDVCTTASSGDASGDEQSSSGGCGGTGAHGSCGVSEGDEEDEGAVVRGAEAPFGSEALRRASDAGRACSVAQSAVGRLAQPPPRGVGTPAASQVGGSVGGAPTSGGGSSSLARRRARLGRPAVSANAFLNAAVALGQGSLEDVRELEDFVVAEPDRDYHELLQQRYMRE